MELTGNGADVEHMTGWCSIQCNPPPPNRVYRFNLKAYGGGMKTIDRTVDLSTAAENGIQWHNTTVPQHAKSKRTSYTEPLLKYHGN